MNAWTADRIASILRAMRPCVPRITVAWLVLGAAVTLVGGCASNAASASDAASEQAEARVFASEVNLRASDVPGFKTVFGIGEGRSGPLNRPIEECDGGPILNEAIHGVVSPLLQGQNVQAQTVLSAVYLMRDPSIASGYIVAADSRRGLGCIQRAEARKPYAGKIEVFALRSSRGGALATGVRVESCLNALQGHKDIQACTSRRVKSFKDRLWFAVGPYVVMLWFDGRPSNKAETPLALLPIERHLIALLYSRAQAYKP
jgi:hypothetical protein